MNTKWLRLLLGASVALAIAAPVTAFAQAKNPKPRLKGTLTGRIVPVVPGAQVVIVLKLTPIEMEIPVFKDGTYMVALDPGEYYVLPRVKGYELAGDLPGYGVLVSIKPEKETTVPDLPLVRTGTLVGRVPGAHPGTVVIAVKRSMGLPEYERFARLASVGEGGSYRIEGLRPGEYDLRIVSPTQGVVDVRPPLTAEDTLSQEDRALIRALESNLAAALRSGDYERRLSFYTTDYQTPEGHTYQRMKEQAAFFRAHPERAELPAGKAAPNARYIMVDWQRTVLVLQGSGDSAVGIVHQTSVDREVKSGRTWWNSWDMRVEYRKADGTWKIARQENIRWYHDIEGKIAIATSAERKPLPNDYVVKYALEADRKSLTIQSDGITTAHDYKMELTKAGDYRPASSR